MSFHTVEQAVGRLNRSELAVPGSQPEMFEKAAKLDVDVVFLDLEDAVAPDEKEQARKNVIKALNEIDWGKKSMSVRINGLDTHYMYRDVVDVVEQAGERLDMIMLPKVGTAADVYAVDMMVTQIEDAKGFKNRIGFEHIIETALGMQNVHEIAAASKRMKAFISELPIMQHPHEPAPHLLVAQMQITLFSPVRVKMNTGKYTGVICGIMRLHEWLLQHALTDYAHLTVHLVTFRIQRAIAPQQSAPQCSGAKANGPFTQARLPLPTKS